MSENKEDLDSKVSRRKILAAAGTGGAVGIGSVVLQKLGVGVNDDSEATIGWVSNETEDGNTGYETSSRELEPENDKTIEQEILGKLPAMEEFKEQEIQETGLRYSIEKENKIRELLNESEYEQRERRFDWRSINNFVDLDQIHSSASSSFIANMYVLENDVDFQEIHGSIENEMNVSELPETTSENVYVGNLSVQDPMAINDTEEFTSYLAVFPDEKVVLEAMDSPLNVMEDVEPWERLSVSMDSFNDDIKTFDQMVPEYLEFVENNDRENFIHSIGGVPIITNTSGMESDSGFDDLVGNSDSYLIHPVYREEGDLKEEKYEWKGNDYALRDQMVYENPVERFDHGDWLNTE